MDILSDSVDFTDFASCIIHPIVRVLDCQALRLTAMDTLSSLVLLLDQKFTFFIPLVNKVKKRSLHKNLVGDVKLTVDSVLFFVWQSIQKNKIQHHLYEGLVTRIMKVCLCSIVSVCCQNQGFLVWESCHVCRWCSQLFSIPLIIPQDGCVENTNLPSLNLLQTFMN